MSRQSDRPRQFVSHFASRDQSIQLGGAGARTRAEVAIMHNSTRKGGALTTMKALWTSPGLQDLWQIHWAYAAGLEYNTPGFIYRQHRGAGNSRRCDYGRHSGWLGRSGRRTWGRQGTRRSRRARGWHTCAGAPPGILEPFPRPAHLRKLRGRPGASSRLAARGGGRFRRRARRPYRPGVLF